MPKILLEAGWFFYEILYFNLEVNKFFESFFLCRNLWYPGIEKGSLQTCDFYGSTKFIHSFTHSRTHARAQNSNIMIKEVVLFLFFFYLKTVSLSKGFGVGIPKYPQ